MLEPAARMARSCVASVVPEPWLQRVRAYRRSDLFRREGVVFVHVPKAAGTSICQALYGRLLGHFSLADVMSACPAEVQALPRFSVARNPWDRLVSAWSYHVAATTKGGRIDDRAGRSRQAGGPECEAFERFVNESLAVGDVHELGGIFRPQSAYLLDSHLQASFDHLGRLETLSETEFWLSDTLGRTVSIARSNTTRHAHYKTYYTPQMRNLVGDIYAQDLALLGYDF